MLTRQRVLRHEDTDDHDIRRARALAPADTVDAGVVDELLEHKLGRLVRGRRGEHRDNERSRAHRVPPDRDVVDVLEQVHAERVDEALRDEHRGVDAGGDAWLGDEVRVERGQGRDEVRATIAGAVDMRSCWNEDAGGGLPDTSSHSDLAEEVEPSGDPRRESCVLGL